MDPRATHLVIVNPSANSGNSKKIVDVVREILRNESVEYITTARPSHATEIASNAAGYKNIVVIGGDGTIHEVVNGMMLIPEEQRPNLALVPSGSGNDSCRMAGVSLDVAEAITTILTGVPKSFDVGLCNDTYFLNSCSVGIDALVVAKTNELKATRKLTGSRLYIEALLHVVTHNLHPISVEISIDGSDFQSREVLLCAVTNGKTYGSGIAINPSAEPDDGMLTSALVDKLSVARVLSYLPAVFRKKHEHLAEFHSQNFCEMTVRSTAGAPLVAQRDGEIFTEHEFAFKTLPASIRIIVPAQVADRTA